MFVMVATHADCSASRSGEGKDRLLKTQDVGMGKLGKSKVYFDYATEQAHDIFQMLFHVTSIM